MSLERLPVYKSRSYLLLLLLAGVILAMFFISKCSHPSGREPRLQVERLKSGGDTIDVAIEISPLAYHMDGDTVAGLDYDIMRAICRAAGRPVSFHVFAPLDYALSGLEEGVYDVVISSIPATTTAKDRFRLSEYVYLDRQVLVQLPDSANYVAAPEDLAGKTVWIATGSPFARRIENLSAEIGDSIHVEMIEGYTAEHLVMLVARGEIPRAVVNSGLAHKMKKEFYPDLDIATPVSFTQFQSWILTPNDPQLADSLDVWIKRFRDTPAYTSILHRHGF